MSVLLGFSFAGLPRVTDIETQYDEGVLVVRWKAPSQNVSDYVIDWIHDGSQFDWKKTKFTNTTLYGESG